MDPHPSTSSTSSTSNRKPNVALAVIFGLLAPGAGIVYAGRVVAGLAVTTATLVVVALLPVLVANDVVAVERYPTILVGVYFVAWAGSAIAGALAALRSTTRVHPWWVLGVVGVVLLGIPLINRTVAPAYVSVVRAPDVSLEPEVHQGALLVVKRRFAPADVKPGALVLVGDSVKRVTSTNSGIELSDGTRTSPADVLGVAVAAR